MNNIIVRDPETEQFLYLSLVHMAEEFRNQSTPDIRNCLQCLFAILNMRFKHFPIFEAKTHLQIGSLLFEYTNNLEHAQRHLKKAWHMALNLPNCQDMMFESISQVAKVYEKLNQNAHAKEVLKKGIDDSKDSPYWHLRMTFQLSQLHANDEEYAEAAKILNEGADYSSLANAQYSRILLLLSRGMMLMITKRITEVQSCLQIVSQLVENWTGNSSLKEGMKVYFLVLQVCHHLNCGQVKSVRQSLKLLQQSIQNIYNFDDEYLSLGPNDQFIWMPKEHMGVLVYLVTVLHSMQSGFMEKAQKYVDKAISQIEKLRSVGNHSVLNTFQLILLEHISMCRLVMGNRALAIKEIVTALNICYREPKLKIRHKPLIHALLGMYAMSLNIMDTAENQLVMSMNLSNPPNQNTNGDAPKVTGQNKELCVLTSLNLAIVYLRNSKINELNELLAKLNPDTLHFTSQSLKAAAFYVLGLNAYYHGRFNDAKRYLRETLKMANAEDLNRLTSCSLVLLGHIFFSLGNSRESLNMVTPAQQLASKIPDIQVQLWAAALLKSLMENQQREEAMHQYDQFDQILRTDQYTALQMPEHNYIHWYEN